MFFWNSLDFFFKWKLIIFVATWRMNSACSDCDSEQQGRCHRWQLQGWRPILVTTGRRNVLHRRERRSRWLFYRWWGFGFLGRLGHRLLVELIDTTKKLMSSPKCRSVKVINNPARPGSNHREVNCINYK